MAKKTMSTKLSKCELVFEDGKLLVIEHLKDEIKEFSLEEILKDYEGKSNINISISVDKEI